MDIKHFFEKLKSVFTSDKKLAVLCAVGVLGVVLLILSEFIPSGEHHDARFSRSVYRRDHLGQALFYVLGVGLLALRGGGRGARAKGKTPGNNRRSRYQRVARIYHENVGVTAPFK